MNTTFNFGSGEVPAHRHINPDGSIGGWVAETATVAPTAYIGINAQVSGTARVYGDAQVFGTARVYGDSWSTSPLYIQGTKHSITNCAYGKLAIGCEVHTFEEWKSMYKEIGKKNGYTEEEIKEYEGYIWYICTYGN